MKIALRGEAQFADVGAVLGALRNGMRVEVIGRWAFDGGTEIHPAYGLRLLGD